VACGVELKRKKNGTKKETGDKWDWGNEKMEGTKEKKKPSANKGGGTAGY